MNTRAELLSNYRASYVTDPLSLGPIGLYRVAPSLGFYRRLAYIVFRCSEFGRYGQFSRACWQEFSALTTRAFEEGGVPVMVENLEVFDRLGDRPCVIIGNHMSAAETFMPAGFLLKKRPITYVVKRGLVEQPVFKHIMRACDPIVVGRSDPREDLRSVLTGGIERLGRGISLIIFPQRTRTVKFDPSEFNSIGVKLARKAKVPVIPFAVKTDAWGNGKRFKDLGPFDPNKPVHLAFGEPLEVEGNGREENEAVIDFIQERLAAWSDWDRRWREHN